MSLAQRANGFLFLQILRQQMHAALATPGAIARSSLPLVSASISLPTIYIPIPGLVSDIWEGVLRAVPKKKTSHMKKRHRQLAGKALKDVNAVNNCPGCGKPKKAHTLCPYCVAEIKDSWKQAAKQTAKECADAQIP